MAIDLRKELVRLAQSLHSQSIDYGICGGIAVAIHGYPRSTQDIDILIREEDLEDVERVAREAGFTHASGLLPFDTGTDSERRIFRLAKVEGDDLLTLDLVLVTSVLENVWADRERVRLGETEVQVVSRRGLAMMKRISGRPIDMADLENLEGEEQP